METLQDKLYSVFENNRDAIVKVYAQKSLPAVDKDGKEIEIPCDSVISSAGYIPAPLVKQGKNIHLVGDCRQVGNLRTVIWRAYETAMKI